MRTVCENVKLISLISLSVVKQFEGIRRLLFQNANECNFQVSSFGSVHREVVASVCVPVCVHVCVCGASASQ